MSGLKALKIVLFLMGLAAPAAALAKSESCQTSIGGETVSLFYDDRNNVSQNTTLRERVFGGRKEITCPAYVTLRHLTPGLTDPERQPFCLEYDSQAGTYLGYALGKRGAYLACKDPSKAFCGRVNASTDAALQIAGLAADKAEDATEVAETVTRHASGAVILSGTTGSVTAALSSLGATAMSVVTAPATLTAAAVTVVAVGGAVYVCRE